MADSLHYSLQKFRQTVLTAAAELEFELRHNQPQQSCCAKSVCCADTESEAPIDLPYGILEGRYQALAQKTEHLEATLKQVLQTLHNSSQSQPIVVVESRVEDLLNVQPPQNTRNVVVSSVKNTPALAAALAAAVMPPAMDLNEEEEDEEMEVDEEEEEEVEVDEEEEEEEQEEDEKMEVEEEEVEVEEEEEEEEEEQEEEETMEVDEEEVEVEEEEEGIEVEEFEYKGQTYQRDAENNVYLEGEPVGTWNGKRIIPLPA